MINDVLFVLVYFSISLAGVSTEVKTDKVEQRGFQARGNGDTAAGGEADEVPAWEFVVEWPSGHSLRWRSSIAANPQSLERGPVEMDKFR